MTRTLRIALLSGASLLALATFGTDSNDGSDAGYGGYAESGYGPQGYSQGGYSQGGDGQGGYGGDAYSGSAGGSYSSAQTMSDQGDASMDDYWARDAASDEQQRQFINGINETADVYDAESGTTYYGVDNSSDAYWANPTTGDVVGTDAYADSPDPYSYNETTNLDDM